jgi:hypothetical protein
VQGALSPGTLVCIVRILLAILWHIFLALLPGTSSCFVPD